MSARSALRAFVCLAIVLLSTTAFADDAPAKAKKPSEARIKGMKAAIADIEKGRLVEKHLPYPDAPQHREYFDAIKSNYGVAIEVVDEKSPADREERQGYNDVMRAEIEHRFGRGVLDKAHKEAWGDEAEPQVPPAKK